MITQPTRTLRRTVLATAGLGLAVAPAALGLTPHDDDPKILDRKAPIQGTGFRRALAGLDGVQPPATPMAAFGTSAISVQSWLTFADLGNANDNGNDCWGYTSPSGREYALMGVRTATVVVEITDPTNAQVIGRINGPSSTWRDIKTYQDRAYTVSEGGGGIQVIDLSDVDNGNVVLETSITGNGTDATHNVAIDEESGFLYRCGGGGNGLRIYDLANPGNPVYVGDWSTRYVHDAQIVTYTTGPYAGKQVAFCCGGFNGGYVDTGLTIVDVTDKSNPTVMSQVSYPAREYSHQGWLSGDRTRFYLGDELDEGQSVSVTTTRVFDVEDLNNATYVGAFDNGDPAIGHNMYEKNGLLFQANYTSGLRVFDTLADIDQPREIAFYDTAPNSSATNFNGLWSCFPYFESGTVIGSDRERGLFVWSVDIVRIEITSPIPTIIDPNGETLTVEIAAYQAGDLDPSSPTLIYDIGAGQTNVALAPTGTPGVYTATFPALPCGSSVSWHLSAATLNGSISTFPVGGAAEPITSLVADGISVARNDDMEQPAGWTGGLPGDTATSGQWERGDPNGTAAQPEDDHTVAGTDCWFTGQAAPGAGVGSNDVDDGFTTLLSPVLNMSTLSDPTISYWRWYSNDQGNQSSDVFDVEISNDGGSTWTLLERVGPSGPGTGGGWVHASFRVSSVVTPTNEVQVRFIAADLGQGSIIEAAIDDFKVEDVQCGPPIGTSYCNGVQNSTGNVGEIVATGSNEVAQNNLTLRAVDLPPNVFGFFVVSDTQAFVPNAGGAAGNLCLGGGIGRYLAQVTNSGANGEIPLNVDTGAIQLPNGTTPAMPGETWYFQCWHRDTLLQPTSNFTRGFAVTFQ